jgi:hypothetical protein
MTKEREFKMKLVTSNETEVTSKEDKRPENKVYQSNPVKSDLYSKLLTYRQSLKKFKVEDLIRDNLK